MGSNQAKVKLLLQALVILGLIVLPIQSEDFYTELMAKTFVLGIFSLSLYLLVGVTGLVSLGHAAYFGVAAYAVTLLTPKSGPLSIWIGLPCAVVLAALVALLVGIFVLRTRGVYFIMVTLAFSQMVFYVFHDTDLGGGSDGIYLDYKPSVELGTRALMDLSSPLQIYYALLASLMVIYVFLRALIASPFGAVLQGIKSNEQRMISLGYGTFRYKLAAFTLAGALAGFAGFWYAVLFGFVTPELMSWHESGNVLLMVILGGLGNLGGALAGALVFVGMQEIFKDLTKHWQLLMGSVIVLAVLFLPGGLVALPRRLSALIFGGDSGDE
jgi:branched-chain amino acid transport system permease protein